MVITPSVMRSSFLLTFTIRLGVFIKSGTVVSMEHMWCVIYTYCTQLISYTYRRYAYRKKKKIFVYHFTKLFLNDGASKHLSKGATINT